MNDAMLGISLITFALLPPALLIWRLLYGKPSWWLIVPTVIIVGWLSWIGMFLFYQLDIAQMIQRGEEPPEGWDSDGAAGLFAIFGGWIMALAYFILWLFIYALIVTIRRVVSSNNRDTVK